MKKANKTTFGKLGEEIVTNYLISSGYKILKRNFYFGKVGEIDIIAEKDNILIFFEIKIQGTNSFGDSKYWITKTKQQKLRKTAEGYLFINKIVDQDCRFDAIFVDFCQNPPRIEHIENAF